MKKRFTRILSFLLALIVLAGVLTACSSAKNASPGENGGTTETTDNAKVTGGTASAGGQLPVTKDPITLTYFFPFTSNIIKDLSENEVYKELEKRTNVKIKFLHPSGDANQALQLLLASKDLPDIIENTARNYPGGPDKAVSDGVYLRLNELIDQFAPNYKMLRESDKEIARQTTTDEGNIWAFANIQTMDEQPWTGLRIRKDWLDDLGLAVPTTVDELYTVMKAFKEKKQAEVPLTLWDSWMDGYGILIGAWDIGNEFYMVDKQVKFGPTEPAYKDYVTTMRKWYSEGLLDKEFATRNYDGRNTLIANNKCGVFNDTSDPTVKKNTVALPYVTLKAGDKRHYSLVNYHNKGNEACITTACKYPEIAVKWFDYHYGDEGFMLFNYGIEGLSYTMVDGKPQFTDLMTKNNQGYSATDLSWVYKVHVGPYKRDYMAFPGMDQQFIQEMKTWGDSTDGNYVLPPITLNADEGSEFSEIMNEIRTYVNENTLKFIMGLEPMEKFDSFVEQINKMNIKRATEIQQAALDRYYKR